MLFRSGGGGDRSPAQVVEAALAHVVGNKVEAAYARSDLFERRRTLMNDWARYVAGAHPQHPPIVEPAEHELAGTAAPCPPLNPIRSCHPVRPHRRQDGSGGNGSTDEQQAHGDRGGSGIAGDGEQAKVPKRDDEDPGRDEETDGRRIGAAYPMSDIGLAGGSAHRR